LQLNQQPIYLREPIMAVLVTGGAGYIGSHVAHALAGGGESVVVLDNLSSGNRAFVPASAHFVAGSAGDAELVREVIEDHGVQAVLHFAGSIVVPESIERPLDYYENNTAVSRTLIETCVALKVGQFVFSSTAAVYGETSSAPVNESAATRPLSPYGRSKLMSEWMLEDAAKAHDFRYIALRYFNVAGVDPSGGAGQPDRQVPHLIKRAAQVALGRAPQLDVFGTDYPTPDGTAVRDYIHIRDLVAAHLLSLRHLRAGGAASVYNCGYGKGASVLEVVSAFERVTGQGLPVRHAPRREGDAPSVVADSSRLREELGWTPGFDRLDAMVGSALEWERQASVH
jgi:UDP-glucose 4-epimerase